MSNNAPHEGEEIGLTEQDKKQAGQYLTRLGSNTHIEICGHPYPAPVLGYEAEQADLNNPNSLGTIAIKWVKDRGGI